MKEKEKGKGKGKGKGSFMQIERYKQNKQVVFAGFQNQNVFEVGMWNACTSCQMDDGECLKMPFFWHLVEQSISKTKGHWVAH